MCTNLLEITKLDLKFNINNSCFFFLSIFMFKFNILHYFVFLALHTCDSGEGRNISLYFDPQNNNNNASSLIP